MRTQAGEPCCAPSAERRDASPLPPASAGANAGSTDGMVLLPGGVFLMGAEDREGFAADGEGPVRSVRVSAFWIDPTAVSNARFAAFVEATGYVTEAERFGASFVFGGLLPDDFPATRAVASAPWWREVEGASWRTAEGPRSTIDTREDHPVVHVSWRDASAYCAWAGLRLPTEAEWEYAARGGLVAKRYPWGDELTPGGQHMCNIWQGTFPSENTVDDGFVGTAPVDAFPANGFGLHNVAGNVWEWCADWFSATWHAAPRREPASKSDATPRPAPGTPRRAPTATASSSPATASVRGPYDDPVGPAEGEQRVIRGGSYLCHASYCNRYRVAARSSNTPESTTGHMGFRCARDA